MGFPSSFFNLETNSFTNSVWIAIQNEKTKHWFHTAWTFPLKAETLPLFQIYVFLLKQYREAQVNLTYLFTLCNFWVVQVGKEIGRSPIQPLLRAQAALNSVPIPELLLAEQVLQTLPMLLALHELALDSLFSQLATSTCLHSSTGLLPSQSYPSPYQTNIPWKSFDTLRQG